MAEHFRLRGRTWVEGEGGGGGSLLVGCLLA